MRIFLTGGTGYIGSAVARTLIGRGHDVVGLARSPTSAARLRRAGVEPVLGTLDDQQLLRRALSGADAVVLAAFHRDYLHHLDDAITLDQASVHATIATLTAAGKTSIPLIYTSGIGVVGQTGDDLVTEDTPVETPPAMHWRRNLELDVLATGGVVLRPGLVYGHGGGHVIETMIRSALRHGRAVYPTPGTYRWPNVHVDDLAASYALTLDHAPPATLLHVVGATSTAKAMSEAVARLIGKPGSAVGMPLDEARHELPIADYMTSHQHVDGGHCRQLLGWEPSGPSITEDIANGSYTSLLRGGPPHA
jgi:nucleoside-diphosphate-sugar epimerase